MCIFSFNVCKNKPYSWRSKSRDFSKCISDGHASRNMGHIQGRNYENLYLCPSKLNGIYRKLNKLNLVANAVVFVI